MRRLTPAEAARRALAAVPPSAAVLVHFDVDVMRKDDMPAAYFPHAEGLTTAETTELLGTVLADPRIRLVEVAEYVGAEHAFDRLMVPIVVNDPFGNEGSFFFTPGSVVPQVDLVPDVKQAHAARERVVRFFRRHL